MYKNYVEMEKTRYEEVMKIYFSMDEEEIEVLQDIVFSGKVDYKEKLEVALKPYGLTIDEWFVAIY